MHRMSDTQVDTLIFEYNQWESQLSTMTIV